MKLKKSWRRENWDPGTRGNSSSGTGFSLCGLNLAPTKITQAEACATGAGELFLLQLQFGFIVFQKLTKFWRGVQQPDPLFVIQCDREPSQTIDAYSTFFTDLKIEFASSALRLFFEFRDFGF